jgi:cytochrome P450
VEAEGTKIDGEFILGGTDDGTGIYAIQHNPILFSDPTSFNPDRWLDDNSGTFTPSAVAPFSLGPRGCFGKPLSLAELRLLTAHLVWKYDIKLAGGGLASIGRGSKGLGPGRERVREFQLWDHINAISHGPYVCFKVRTK